MHHSWLCGIQVWFQFILFPSITLRVTESIKAGFLAIGLNTFTLNLSQNSMLSKYAFALNFSYLKLIFFNFVTFKM